MSYEGDPFLKNHQNFYVNFINVIKIAKNIFGFEDNSGWICCTNFFQLWQEYLWSTVNMLQNRPMISDPTKSHDTQPNLFDINGKLS